MVNEQTTAKTRSPSKKSFIFLASVNFKGLDRVVYARAETHLCLITSYFVVGRLWAFGCGHTILADVMIIRSMEPLLDI